MQVRNNSHIPERFFLGEQFLSLLVDLPLYFDFNFTELENRESS